MSRVSIQDIMNLFRKDSGVSELIINFKDEYGDWAIASYILKGDEWIYIDSNSYCNFTLNDIVKKCSVHKDTLSATV